MRNSQDLAVGANLVNLLSDGLSHTARNACIHFVKDNAGLAFLTRKGRLDSQHETGELPARRNLHQRFEILAWICRDVKLYLFIAFTVELALTELHFKTRLFHVEILQLLLDFRFQLGC